VLEDLSRRKRDVAALKKILEISDSRLEVEHITAHRPLAQKTSPKSPPPDPRTLQITTTYLLGISLFVIGSYPTHFTPAFAQLAQLGSL
jgi:hypothetical protein